MSETIYCGSGKKKSDTWLQITINPDKVRDHIKTFKGKRYIKLNVNIKDTPNEHGKDVSVSVDTWEPDNKLPEVKNESTDDLPF